MNARQCKVIKQIIDIDRVAHNHIAALQKCEYNFRSVSLKISFSYKFFSFLLQFCEKKIVSFFCCQLLGIIKLV